MNDLSLQSFFNSLCNLPFLSKGGRANVLLFSIFKTLPKGSKIIFPAIMCPSPLLVAEYAGVVPVLADVSKAGLISVDSVKKLILKFDDVSAIVSVNLYGERPDNKSLYNLCHPKNILLIEDAAQWWSPNSLGKDVDVSILSFGSKKIIDCQGGGISLTNNEELFLSIEEKKKKIHYTKIEKIRFLSSFYSRLYYLLAEGEKHIPGTMNKFIFFKEEFRELYFPDESNFPEQLILEKLNLLTNDSSLRYKWAKKYEDFFQQHNLFEAFVHLDKDSGPWRYSVFFQGKDKEGFMSFLRENKVDVSSWYPDLSSLGFNVLKTENSASADFGQKILNFWVEDMNEEKFNKTLNVIKKYKETR